MSGMEWFLSFSLIMLYLTCLFTVCGLTFRKGHTVLGIVGIFFPILWLVGAVLPAKEGSRYDVAQAMSYQAQAERYSR